MKQYWFFWSGESHSPPKDNISKFIFRINDIYRRFLISCSCYVYIIAIVLILLCVNYYIQDCRRRNNLRRRRLEIRRDNDRAPQRRRPGAVYRDHEIFRHILKKIREYIRYAEGGDPLRRHTQIVPSYRALMEGREGTIHHH